MLIRDAELWGKGRADLRIAEGRIAAIGTLAALPGEAVVDARGGALLPGLHDHPIHLAAHGTIQVFAKINSLGASALCHFIYLCLFGRERASDARVSPTAPTALPSSA